MIFLECDQNRLRRILAHTKKPLAAAAAMNATRNRLYFSLQSLGLPLETATGGRTKFNRSRLHIPKSHALDAACVGEVETVTGWRQLTLGIKASGRGRYQRTTLNAHGFPRGFLTRAKQIHGFQTGDMVKAVVPKGKRAGYHFGKVAVRASGYFNIQSTSGPNQGISWKYCTLVQRNDGYSYSREAAPTTGSLLQASATLETSWASRPLPRPVG